MRQLLSDIALIPDDHRRGKTFERAVKWLLENAPETRNQFKKVWLWDDYPDREGRDLGIDLVAETLQGTRWAIQAKCYGPDQPPVPPPKPPRQRQSGVALVRDGAHPNTASTLLRGLEQ